MAGDEQPTNSVHLSRRAFLHRVSLGLASVVAVSQTACGIVASPPKMRRIGYLDLAPSDSHIVELAAFRDELRGLGYFEGQNLGIEERYAEGDGDLPAKAAELAALGLAVVIAFGTTAIEAANANIAPPMPIVMASCSDPQGAQFVDTLAHPGGRITGLTSLAPRLTGKRLQLLLEALPRVQRVGYFWNSKNDGDRKERETIVSAAATLQVELVSLDVFGLAQTISSLFTAAVDQRVDALITFASGLINNNGKEIVRRAAEQRLPAIYAQRNFVTAYGGLMAYGPDYPSMYRRAAVFVTKLLQGASPATLPVETPRRFELVVGRAATQALRLEFPRDFLDQVDGVS